MNRRRFLTQASALLGLPVLGFCSGGCGGAATNRDGRLTLRYMAWGGPEQIRVERRICAAFEELHPEIHVHLFMVPGQAYADKLQLMLASRTAPDVMRVDQYFFPALARKEYFLSLDPFIAAEPLDFLEDFHPIAREEGRWQGRVYGLNVLWGGIMIYYNQGLFRAAGLPDPYRLFLQDRWTWEQFVECAVALTRKVGGRVVQFGTNHVLFPLYASVIWNHGGEVMDPDMTRLVMAEDPGAVLGFQRYADLRWKHQCAPSPAENALSPFAFESGRTGMVWGWAGETPRYRRSIRDFPWDICPTPAGPTGHHTLVKGNQLVINRETRYPEAAWKFLKYMTSPDAERLLCTRLRRSVPTRLSVLRDPAYLKTDQPPFQTEVFLETSERGRVFPIDWRYQEWVEQFNTGMEPLFAMNERDARSALTDACARANAVLAGEDGF